MTELNQKPGWHRGRLVLLATLLFVAAVWGGTTLVYGAGNSEFERISPVVVAAVCLLVSVCVIVGTWLIFLVSGWLRIRAAAVAVLLWLAVFAAVSSLLAPLPVGVGMTDLDQYSLSLLNLGVSMASAMAVTAILYTPLAKIAIWGVAAFCLSTLAQAGWTLVSPNFAANKAANDAMQLAAQGNILVIGFDGLQRDVFQEAIAANPDLLHRLNEFTLFSNVVSSSPATQASTAAELLGNMNFKAAAETTEELMALAAREGIPAELSGAGYRVGGYGVYSSYLPPEKDLGPFLVDGNSVGETTFLLQNTVSRTIGPWLAVHGWVEPALIIVSRIVSPMGGGKVSHLSEQIAIHSGPNWDRYLLKSRDDFASYEDRLTTGASTPVAHFLHFTFTHHPVDFDEQCQFRSTDQKWFDRSQDHEGILGEARCSIILFEQILQRLDDLGVLEKSLVIIKSDHGAPIQWNDPNSLAAQRIRGNDTWGYGRYMPILLIKPPGTPASQMAVDQRPVILDDLAGTVCNWAGLQDCGRYAGANLLDPADSGPEKIWMNVAKSAGADFRYDTHESVEVERAGDPVANLHDYIIDTALGPLDCNPVFARIADLPIMTWRIGDAQMLRITERGCTDLTLFLRSDSGLEAAVSADLDRDFEASVSTVRVKIQSRTGADGIVTSNVALDPTTTDRWTFAGLTTARQALPADEDIAISSDLLLSGWHQIEPWGAWSAEPVAALRVEFDEGEVPRELSFSGQVFVPGDATSHLEALLNGTVVADLTLDSSNTRVNARVAIPPDAFSASRSAVLAFRLSEVHSPAEFGGDDVRNLGFGLEQLSFR